MKITRKHTQAIITIDDLEDQAAFTWLTYPEIYIKTTQIGDTSDDLMCIEINVKEQKLNCVSFSKDALVTPLEEEIEINIGSITEHDRSGSLVCRSAR